MKKLVMWLAALSALVGLSACGSSGISGEAARMIAGQVADYDGPAGALEAETGFSDTVSVGEGSIDADGNFSFELDSTVPESGLATFEFEENCSEVKVSNSEAKVLSIINLVTAEGGSLTLGREDPDSDTTVEVAWIYVDQPLSLRGTCETSDSFGVDRDTYDLNLKRGWNVITVRYSQDEANNFEFDFRNGRAADVAWSYN